MLLSACSGTEPVGYEFMKEEGEGEVGVWVHSGLYNREYEVHVPPNVAQGDRRPLVVFLHGEGDTGPAFRRRLKADAVTDARRLITVWPTGLQGTWTVGCAVPCTLAEAMLADDIRFVRTLVKRLASALPVDTSRVYIIGFSQGAQLAQHIACRSDFVPAGVGVVAGQIFRSVAQTCAPGGAFPVGIVHGTEDPLAAYMGFGPGAVVMSVPETVMAWMDQMGCGGEPSLEIRPDTAGDYTITNVFRFPGCRPGSALVLYQVLDGGHTWPGRTGPWPVLSGVTSRSIDATWELLELLQGMEPRLTAPE
ncbi:MAG: hypothetical protein FIA95_00370 [Gemmatimonadetes bacterium]|nr:hypothetical protein [Gemmatimonadota bacterium]